MKTRLLNWAVGAMLLVCAIIPPFDAGGVMQWLANSPLLPKRDEIVKHIFLHFLLLVFVEAIARLARGMTSLTV